MLTQRLSVRCFVGIVSALPLCALPCPSGAQAQNKAAPADTNPLSRSTVPKIADDLSTL